MDCGDCSALPQRPGAAPVERAGLRGGVGGVVEALVEKWWVCSDSVRTLLIFKGHAKPQSITNLSTGNGGHMCILNIPLVSLLNISFFVVTPELGHSTWDAHERR